MTGLREGHAVPFDAIQYALSKLEYATGLRVMFEMLALTGCRIRALDNMRTDRLLEGCIYWYEGKHTQRLRKERLPDWYIEELRDYRERLGALSGRLFSMSSESFRKAFRHARPAIAGGWEERVISVYQNSERIEFKHQLKGLRKTFQTYAFAAELDRWKDAGTALQFTSKRMRHQSERVTAHHYLQHFEELRIPEVKTQEYASLVRNPGVQSSLLEY